MKYEVVAQKQDGSGTEFVTEVIDTEDTDLPEKGALITREVTVTETWQVIRVTEIEEADDPKTPVDESVVDYDAQSHDELHDEIVRRNNERGIESVTDERYIAVTGNKAELAQRLRDDDEAS